MDQKALIWTGMIVGSTLGGFVPLLWGSDLMSMSSIILTGAGGLGGIWLAFRMSR
jgi:hypothetical protein